MDGFQVDVLLSSLRELQLERERLIQKLQHARNRRKDMESQLEVVIARNNQANDRYNKMLETSSLAKQKVEKIRGQVDELQTEYEQRQTHVGKVMKDIEDEKSRQYDEAREFEKKLQNLTGSFRHAHKFYTDTSLEEECNKLKDTTAEAQRKAQKEQEEHEKLQKQIKSMAVREERQPQKTESHLFLEQVFKDLLLRSKFEEKTALEEANSLHQRISVIKPLE